MWERHIKISIIILIIIYFLITYENSQFYEIEYFYSDRCSVCQNISAQTQKINKKYNINCIDVNKFQKNYSYATSQGVKKIPAYVIIKNGRTIAVFDNIKQKEDIKKIEQIITTLR